MTIQTSHHDQRGIAHIIEIIVIGVIVLGVIGVIIWRVMGAQKPAQTNTTTPTQASQPAANAACNVSDKDICKFFTSWKANAQFKVTSSQTSGGQTTTSTYEASSNGQNYHMTMTVNGAPYEVIGIGNTLFTKDYSDGKWWKQQLQQTQENQVKGDYNYDFKEPTSDTPAPATQEPTYKKLGTETCGNLTCLKYQVIDPSSPDQKQYLWFDNKDYQLRRMRIETGSDASDQTFAYESVAITAPSPTKDLGANQYIVPGQSQPVTLPSGTDLQQYYSTGQ